MHIYIHPSIHTRQTGKQKHRHAVNQQYSRTVIQTGRHTYIHTHRQVGKQNTGAGSNIQKHTAQGRPYSNGQRQTAAGRDRRKHTEAYRKQTGRQSQQKHIKTESGRDRKGKAGWHTYTKSETERDREGPKSESLKQK